MNTATNAEISPAHFERKLRERANQLRGEIRDTLLRADAEQYGRLAGEVHDAHEEAIADLLVDVNLAEIDRDVQELRDIEGALGRIRAGTYGVCIKCQEPINPQRLEAYPTAKRCLRCQQEHERARAAANPPSL